MCNTVTYVKLTRNILTGFLLEKLTQFILIHVMRLFYYYYFLLYNIREKNIILHRKLIKKKKKSGKSNDLCTENDILKL